jgi:BirA family biotin operon repressor/biotin-[acetyl-CoA-carboxylase] ligase
MPARLGQIAPPVPRGQGRSGRLQIMSGVAADGGRPLSAALLRTALGSPDGFWRQVDVVAQTGSTNADLLAAARCGAVEGTVLAAETQTAGRGRAGRSWVSLPGTALTFSVLLRPGSVPPAVRGWLPLLAGVAVAEALNQVAGVDARLKWPNDVLVAGGKVAGILAEQDADAIVVGIGINVRTAEQDLPVATATSLRLHGAGDTDRSELLAAVLESLQRWYLSWRQTGSGDAQSCGLRPSYLRLSATVGQQVQVSMPGGHLLAGTAQDVDGTGRLVVRSEAGLVAVSAGDVIHVR